MDRAAAETEIKALFAHYGHAASMADEATLKAASDGKLYEMFVLSEVVTNLAARGCSLVFQGTTLKFKASPGMIKTSDPHFTVRTPDGPDLWLFCDIEFDTLGQQKTAATDNSRRHELDIVLVTKDHGYPAHGEVWLGVECKAVANFGKDLVKAVLGVRRELSLMIDAQASLLSNAGLSPQVDVAAEPASEFWLAFIDAKGLNYQQSPAAFGVEFRHLEP
jgi:hypothetical protein